jgi:hypothetical protein
MPEKVFKSLEEHLMSRELVDFSVITDMVMAGVTSENAGADITLDDDLLSQVGGVWENNNKALKAVIAGRIKPLIFELLFRDEPQEVMVTRQSIMNLIGVLNDFEKLHGEAIKRGENKGVSSAPPDETL